MEEIYFEKEFKEKFLNGVNKFSNAVAATMGPNGNTVIITDEYGNPHITKDGVSVAKSIVFKDPIENTAAILLKEVASKTAEEAGDGTTTATVLASAFINNLQNFDSKEVVKAFDEIIPKVIQELKNNSRQLKREDIKHVATISANNDTTIGNIIQEAYNFSDIVKVEQSENSEDKIEFINGLKFDTTYFSKHFINDEKKATCNLNNPYVVLLDGKLENLKFLENVLNNVAENDRELLIIAEHVSEHSLRLLESNVLSGNIKLCVIKSPGFAQHRRDLLKDLCYFTGAKIKTDFSNPCLMSELGVLKSAKIDGTSSLLLKDDSINIDEYVEELKELSKESNELTKQRYEGLTGKISIIKVGGGSEIEMKERFDRYDDAVKAVQCALKEGIVEGGGIALLRETIFYGLTFTDIEKNIYKSLAQPCFTIEKNGNMKFTLERNFFEENIIDPLKVTRTALENAVSVAKTVLTTKAIVLNERQWN